MPVNTQPTWNSIVGAGFRQSSKHLSVLHFPVLHFRSCIFQYCMFGPASPSLFLVPCCCIFRFRIFSAPRSLELCLNPATHYLVISSVTVLLERMACKWKTLPWYLPGNSDRISFSVLITGRVGEVTEFISCTTLFYSNVTVVDMMHNAIFLVIPLPWVKLSLYSSKSHQCLD